MLKLVEEGIIKYRHVLLGLSLPWATAGSALRLPFGIGIGEVGLIVWVIGVLLSLRQTKICFRKDDIFIMSLFMIIILTMAGGWVFSSYLAYQSPNAIRDFTAYIFILVLIFSVMLDWGKGGGIAIKWYLVGVVIYISLYGWLSVIDLEIAEQWYRPQAGERWKGLAVNPNQVAFMLLPLPIMTIYYWEKIRVWWALPIYVMGMIFGIKTQSDALMLAWFVTGFILLLARRYNKKKMGSISLFMVIFLPLCSAYPLWNKVSVSSVSDVDIIYDESGNVLVLLVEDGYQYNKEKAPLAERTQVSARLRLWENALLGWWRSPLIGLGPGAHAGFNEPFEGREAHNTILDLMTQAGGVGLIAFAVWWLCLLVKVWRGKAYFSVGMIFCILVFSMFHDVLRHPLFWVFPLAFMSHEMSRAAEHANS